MMLRFFALMTLSLHLLSQPYWVDFEDRQGFQNPNRPNDWKEKNTPWKFDFLGDYLYNFDLLPREGDLESDKKIGWSGSYWPNFRGRLAHRFQYGKHKKHSFGYSLYTFDELKVISPDKIKRLSAAEKLDILHARYDYPFVKSEWKDTARSNPKWWGICDGVSTVSIIYPEPQNAILTNPHGIKIEFTSEDIKGLMAFYYSRYRRDLVKTVQVGKRCRGGLAGLSHACRDVDAATFHIILTNELGIKKRSFIGEIENGREVWNHPVSSFRAYRQKTEDTDYGRKVLMRTHVEYVMSAPPRSTSTLGSGSHARGKRIYSYFLKINHAGVIFDGDWVSKERPDFVWKRNIVDFEGDFHFLNNFVKSVF